ncbi:aldo/keto reductase [bacterium]|nr:aldo/keto reductase [bacterium]
MKYRPFGNTGWNVSALGFGAMRLPATASKSGGPAVDEAESVRMIRAAIDGGVNYVDTAYPYHGGVSETIVGKALAGGYRSRVRLATKSPVWLIQKPGDFDRYLDEQLKRLNVEHVDYYLLHALDNGRWENSVLRHGLLEKGEAAVADGRIGSLGFSFHDGFDAFIRILDGYDKWGMCQIQYNYLDVENQAGTRGFLEAVKRGLPVVVMEPLLGGRLARPPLKIRKMIEAHPSGRTPAEWALSWLWDQSGVSTVLSGMSAMSEIRDNLVYAGRAETGMLEAEDRERIVTIRRAYRESAHIPCTNCGYCMPCPHGVLIPANFGLYNDMFMHENPGMPRFSYTHFFPDAGKASVCVQCGECLGKCPQKIDIPGWMPKVHDGLSGDVKG